MRWRYYNILQLPSSWATKMYARTKLHTKHCELQARCHMYIVYIRTDQLLQSQIVHREYFMESAGVRYLRKSCWRIRNRTSERSERVRFLIQKQRVRKYRTKHFPCGILFIIYILRHSSFWRTFYFKSFKNAKICRYTLTAKWQRKRSISFLVKAFVKNINDGTRIRGNPRTISNLNCLLSMHN